MPRKNEFKTNNEYINELKNLYKNTITYDEIDYKGYNSRVYFKCSKCNTQYNKHAGNLLERHFNCPKCNKVKQESKNFEIFLEKAKKKHGDKFDYSQSDYHSMDKKITIRCPEHGIFYQIPNIHLRSIHACPSCYRIAASDLNLTKKEDIIEKFRQTHGDRYDYSKVVYKGVFEKVEIICPRHGSFYQTPKNHIAGNGCKKCTRHISNISQEWFETIENEVILEYMLPENKNLIVDGYDPQTNTVYQFHGDYWHGNPDVYDQDKQHGHRNNTYGELYEYTKRIDNEIKDYGYNLVVMWENDYRELLRSL